MITLEVSSGILDPPAPLTLGTWSWLKCSVRRAQLLSKWVVRGRQGVLGSGGSSAAHSPQFSQGGCKH